MYLQKMSYHPFSDFLEAGRNVIHMYIIFIRWLKGGTYLICSVSLLPWFDMIGGSTNLNLLFVTWLVALGHLAYSQAPRAELLRDTIAFGKSRAVTI